MMKTDASCCGVRYARIHGDGERFSQEYTEIGFLSNNEVCILNDHSCDIYTVRGIYKFHYDFDEELYKVISGGTGLNYTIILENSTEKVRLK